MVPNSHAELVRDAGRGFGRCVCGCLATVRAHSREVSVPFLVLSMVTVFWVCESITARAAFDAVGAGSFENSELLFVVVVDGERPLYLHIFSETEVLDRVRTHSLLLLFSSTRIISARMEIRNSQDAAIPAGSVKNSRPLSIAVDGGLSLYTTHRKPFSLDEFDLQSNANTWWQSCPWPAGSFENSDRSRGC